jgi:quercetin dioxygenase-like cupin family protein
VAGAAFLYFVAQTTAMKNFIVNPIIKDTARFIRTATDSGITEAEITLMPGGGNPLHYHKTYSETFTALEGRLGLTAGKQQVFLQPGESFTVQPNQLHRFFNANDTEIKFRVELKPGHEGMENALRILYGMAGDGLTNNKSIPKKFKHLALIAYISDMNLPGLPTLLFPIMKKVAMKQIINGEYQLLIERYCI